MRVFIAKWLCIIVAATVSWAEQAEGRKSPFLPTSHSQASITRTVLDVRGGATRTAVAKAPVAKAPATKATSEHHGELMSAQTAIANVLADLCPHGMLPIAFGMAAGGGTGPVLATIILFIFGVLSWYSLVSFARYVLLQFTHGLHTHWLPHSYSIFFGAERPMSSW